MSIEDSTGDDHIDDDEVIYLRVPPFPPFQKPQNWLTSANFKLDLRKNEQGLSVYRAKTRSVMQVLQDSNAIPGSFVVSATVGEIRNLKNVAGTLLNLDVLPRDDGGKNPGHAEIQSPTPGQISKSASKNLRDLFARSGRITES